MKNTALQILAQTQPHNYQRTSKTIELQIRVTWSAKGICSDGISLKTSAADASLFFEIDHSGSWHYEWRSELPLLPGCERPGGKSSHWSEKPEAGRQLYNRAGGCRYRSRPIDFEEAIGTLTKLPQKNSPSNKTIRNPAGYFPNDYMNCLFAESDDRKFRWWMLPKKQDVNTLYHCRLLWDGNWWDSVGEWQESRKRFPNGVREVTIISVPRYDSQHVAGA